VCPEAAATWNKSAPDRWRRLHRRAYQLTRQVGYRPRMLARVWEKQHRGVLHVHPVLAFGTAADRSATHVYVRHLEALAPHYGFGFVERKLRSAPAGAAAAYLSAYFVTGKREKATLHESVTTPDMPRSIIHVSTALTQATGCTMRELRFRRYVWRVAAQWVLVHEYAVARAIARYHQEHGVPPRYHALRAILIEHRVP
jgi:hypothetical protein